MMSKKMRRVYPKQERRNGRQRIRNSFKFFANEGNLDIHFISIILILSSISDAQLKAVFEAYQQFSRRDIESEIKSDTSGSLRTGLLTIGKCEDLSQIYDEISLQFD